MIAAALAKEIAPAVAHVCQIIPLARWGLSPAQLWFLERHASTTILPIRWQWSADESRLTVWLENNVRGTISAGHFNALVRLGLVERIGSAGARITDLGRECLA
jgi:hypothetical protein